jgi:predicted  nucleic acid-binding Zn-ribbon protein
MKLLVATITATILCTALLPGNGWTAGDEKISGLEVKKDMKEAAQKISQYTEQKKEEYVQEIRAKLDEMSKQIAELQERAKTVQGQLRAALESRIADLKEKQSAAEKRLGELQSASSKAWVDMKAGLEMALALVEESYRKAVDRFK